MQEASRYKYQKDVLGMSHDRNQGLHPPSDITDMVFTKAVQDLELAKVTKSNPSLCTKTI